MIHNTRLVPIVALASFITMPGAADAAGIYQCTQADGSITLSDVACPADTLTREYRGEATPSGRPRSPSKDPWSVMNQVKRIEKQKAAERKAATPAKPPGRQTDDTKTPTAKRPRKPSYQEAYRKALEATGYNEDSQLSTTQRERLAEELAKDGYSLREPKKQSTTRKGKSKAPGSGNAAPSAPNPATTVEFSSATLPSRP